MICIDRLLEERTPIIGSFRAFEARQVLYKRVVVALGPQVEGK